MQRVDGPAERSINGNTCEKMYLLVPSSRFSRVCLSSSQHRCDHRAMNKRRFFLTPQASVALYIKLEQDNREFE